MIPSDTHKHLVDETRRGTVSIFNVTKDAKQLCSWINKIHHAQIQRLIPTSNTMLPSFWLLGPFTDDKGFLKTYVSKEV